MRVMIAASLLAALGAISGCASQPETGYVQPSCQPAVIPALPELDRGELWDALGDAEYRRVEAYIGGLWGVIDEQRAIIKAVCQSSSDT